MVRLVKRVILIALLGGVWAAPVMASEYTIREKCDSVAIKVLGKWAMAYSKCEATKRTNHGWGDINLQDCRNAARSKMSNPILKYYELCKVEYPDWVTRHDDARSAIESSLDEGFLMFY